MGPALSAARSKTYLVSRTHSFILLPQFQGVADAKAQGGKVAVGGEVIDGPGNFVQPTVIESTHDMEVVNTELFAPILHVCKVKVRQCQTG